MNHDENNSNDIVQSDQGEMVEATEDTSFGADGFDGGEFATTEPVKKPINTSALIILGVVVLAAAGLWSMRSMAIAMANTSIDSGLEEAIEAALAQIAGGSNSTSHNGEIQSLDGGEVGEVLVDDRTAKQVPLQGVQKNPFAINFLEPVVDPNTPVVPVVVEPDSERLARELSEKFEAAADKLRVLMILDGSDPIANISGRIVHVGDTLYDDQLDVELVVTEIVPGSVYVSGRDDELGVNLEIPLRLHRNG